MLVRYENPQASLQSSRTSPSLKSNACTDSMVSETSCPYAPTFCTGVPPTLPGMPLMHSTPAQLRATARAVNLSQSTPAPTSNTTLPSSSCSSIAGMLTLSTNPGHPASETTRLLPPPRMKKGRPWARAYATASWTSEIVFASTKYRAGPPTFRVVRGASGTFSWMSIIDNSIYVSFPQQSQPGSAFAKWGWLTTVCRGKTVSGIGDLKYSDDKLGIA